jgi:hypothetical protein
MWVVILSAFVTFLGIMFWGYEKEVSFRTNCVIAGILLLLFLIAAYADFVIRQ